MSDVIDINTRTKLDIPVDKVLDGSKDLEVAIVIGWKGEDFYMATSNASIGDNLLLLELARKFTVEMVLECD